MLSFRSAPPHAYVRGRILALEPRADRLHTSVTTVATVRVSDQYGFADCNVGDSVEFDCTFCWPVPSPQHLVGRDVKFSMGWARNATTSKPFVQARWKVEPSARVGVA